MKRKYLLILFFSVCFLSTRGQQTDSLKIDLAKINVDSLFNQIDSIFTADDSLSIFQLIDSLIVASTTDTKSQLAFRLGYNSNIGSTGRTLGINKFGLSPGVSFYHKSGAYVDASTYWSQEYDPDFYLSVLSAGYLWSVTKRWSLVAEYNRYLYNHPAQNVPYKNNAGVTNFIEFKPFTFRLDYYLYFGEKTGQRIMPGVFVSLQKKNWHNINRILLYPSFNVMFGSERVIKNVLIARTAAASIAIAKASNGTIAPLKEVTKTIFGVMNYSFSLPLSVTWKKWNFLVSYTYNIPIALPGEDLGLTNSGYASASITRYLNFK